MVDNGVIVFGTCMSRSFSGTIDCCLFVFVAAWFGSQPDRRPGRYVSVSLLDRLTAAVLRLRLGGGGEGAGVWYCCYCISALR